MWMNGNIDIYTEVKNYSTTTSSCFIRTGYGSFFKRLYICVSGHEPHQKKKKFYSMYSVVYYRGVVLMVNMCYDNVYVYSDHGPMIYHS